MFTFLLKIAAGMPMWMMKGLSDIMFLLIYYVVKYRRTITQSNLKRCFPTYSEKEIRVIEKKFYRHFCDMLLWTLKLALGSPKTLYKHVNYINKEYPDSIAKKGKSIILFASHFGCWENTSLYQPYTVLQCMGAYQPLTNHFFDRLMIKSRTRFGAKVAPLQQIFRLLVKTQQEGRQPLAMFVADQSPAIHWIKEDSWITFFGQPTAAITSIESIAKKIDNSVVVFFKTYSPKRFYYNIEFVEITDNPQEKEHGWITQTCFEHLEEMIREQPQLWLWSYRRWKYNYLYQPKQ